MTTRRKPQQARSLKRYHHILDTAAQIFADIGVEAATTNLIAERADVSIGSLYQYFPNKEAVLEGLVEQYVEEYRAFNADKFRVVQAEAMTVTALIHHTIDSIMSFESEHVGFYTIFAQTALLSDQLIEATREIHQEVVSQVVAMIHNRFPEIPSGRVHLYGAMVVSIVKNMKMLTLPPDNLPPQQVVSETKHAVLAYIRDILIREELPLPDDLA